jgi:S-(hydroxymethyl)glutathione dehydrogenase / alcohol dehydrogenase
MPLIRAAICHEFGKPLVVEPVMLAAPGPGEVEITLRACAVCHSDISYADGGWGGALPAVYGHEAAGHISALGPGTSPGLQMGQAVLATLIRACGTCPTCATGAPAYCETSAPAPGPLSLPDGTPVSQGMACGAFAERVVVHQSQLATLPDDIPMEVACLLSCGVITGIGAVVHTARLRAGETVVVIGAGGVGLNAIQGARIAGASRIIAVDLNPDKLTDARDFGATDGVLATDPKPWNAVRALTGGRGADAVFVTVGAIPAYETAPRYLAARGRIVMVGMPHSGARAQYEPVILAALGQGMIGSKMGDVVLSRDIPWMLDLYRQGRLELDALVSGRYTLDQINHAIESTRAGGARRNVIVF